MNEYTATILIITVQYGSSVLILPGIMNLLGPTSFTMILFSMMAFYMFCALLANNSFLHILQMRNIKIEEISRWPMKVFAYEAYGRCFSKFSVYLQTTLFVLYSSSMLLLAVQTLQVIIRIDNVASTLNQVRVWILIITVVLILPSFYGTYQELGVLTFVSFGCVCLCEICVIIASILVYYSKDIYRVEEKIELLSDTQSTYEMFVSSVGEIIFTTSGLAILLPNITVTISNKDKLKHSIVWGLSLVFMLYLTSAAVPYLLLKDVSRIEPSIINTLTRISNASQNTTLRGFIIVAQLTISLHFVLVIILFNNPVYLFIEEKCNIPKGK